MSSKKDDEGKKEEKGSKKDGEKRRKSKEKEFVKFLEFTPFSSKAAQPTTPKPSLLRFPLFCFGFDLYV